MSQLSPERIAEESRACCAHRRVLYKRIQHVNGLCADSWVCEDCNSFFWPASHTNALQQTLASTQKELEFARSYNLKLRESNVDLISREAEATARAERAEAELKHLQSLAGPVEPVQGVESAASAAIDSVESAAK